MDLKQASRNRNIVGTLLQDPKITEVMVIGSLARYLTEGEIQQVINELTLEEGGL